MLNVKVRGAATLPKSFTMNSYEIMLHKDNWGRFKCLKKRRDDAEKLYESRRRRRGLAKLAAFGPLLCTRYCMVHRNRTSGSWLQSPIAYPQCPRPSKELKNGFLRALSIDLCFSHNYYAFFDLLKTSTAFSIHQAFKGQVQHSSVKSERQCLEHYSSSAHSLSCGSSCSFE